MMTCMVMTPVGRCPKVTLESANVLLFSKILPACISFTSFTDFGVIVLSEYVKTHQKLGWRNTTRKDMKT